MTYAITIATLEACRQLLLVTAVNAEWLADVPSVFQFKLSKDQVFANFAANTCKQMKM